MIALGLGIGASWWISRATQSVPYQPLAATIWPQPATLAPFSLTNDQNQPFTNKNLNAKWTLFFFGYTHCPDVCPTALSTFNSIAQTLEKTPEIYQQIQFVFVSVDPQRDTSKILDEYVHYFNKDFIGVTGPISDIYLFASQMSIPYARMIKNEDNEEDYQVDHSSTVVLTNPLGQKFGIFSSPHNALRMANDLKHFVISQTGT